ncbi:hypothetical protein [Rubrivirga sp. IMCC43871]|uniref:hypothetical protein n=1 Tax=Rubrivirga sp. IMCC43871 TaxID=3391575 RepID=UPI00398FE921
MPSAHLLRTLASVAPGTVVADLSAGETTPALVALGFDVVAVSDAAIAGASAVARPADLEDASADWVVVGAPDDGFSQLPDAARVLRAGGWVWIAADGPAVLAAAAGVGLVVSEAPGVTDGAPHVIFRKPGAVG